MVLNHTKKECLEKRINKMGNGFTKKEVIVFYLFTTALSLFYMLFQHEFVRLQPSHFAGIVIFIYLVYVNKNIDLFDLVLVIFSSITIFGIVLTLRWYVVIVSIILYLIYNPIREMFRIMITKKPESKWFGFYFNLQFLILMLSIRRMSYVYRWCHLL